jgi:hypothetical protein
MRHRGGFTAQHDTARPVPSNDEGKPDVGSEDGETATDFGRTVGHHHGLDHRDQFAMVAAAIWLVSRVVGVDAEIAERSKRALITPVLDLRQPHHRDARPPVGARR